MSKRRPSGWQVAAAVRHLRQPPRFKRPPIKMVLERIAGREIVLLLEADRIRGGQMCWNILARAVLQRLPGGTVASLEADLAALDRVLKEARRLRQEARSGGDMAAVERLNRLIYAGDGNRATVRRTLQHFRRVWDRLRVLPPLGRAIAQGRPYHGPEARPEPRRRKERATIECAGCGKEFEPRRRDGRYCSPACRQRAYRKRK